MTVKTSSRLALVLSHACPRRRLAHPPRRLHQALARPPLSRVEALTDDDHLHALYQDLMTLDSATTRTSQPVADLQRLQHSRGAASPALNNLSSPTIAPSQTVDVLLAEYAKRGNTQDFESFMSRMLSAPPTEHQRDLHVKAHIVNASLPIHSSSISTTQRFPTTALAALHQYEANGHFAPMKSYTRVISALFNVRTCPSADPRLGRAAAQAQAWDLFAHMRYVAHPVPDSHLYALMIRACALFSRPEPERALDLWMEMQENGVKPTKGAYEAVIRVCGRAGPEWLGEGMRLAREMSDQYPITGVHGRGLWCALLEGCKRAGDLKKARWILAEAVRGTSDGANTEDSMVDAEFMTHIFHTYASYKPPFRREMTRLIDHGATFDGQASNELRTEETSSNSDPPSCMSDEQTQGSDAFLDISAENVESIPSFSRLPPQTSSEVVAESRSLFSRILQDGSLEDAHHSPEVSPLVGRFARVQLTSVVLNAYLSVFYGHASIETSQDAFDSLFNDPSSAQGSHADEYTYINALERCAIARAEDRHVAVRWAKDVWRRWEDMEAEGLRDGKGDVGSFARLIERAHTAMRRVLILSGDVDGALALLRSFVSRYPPNAVLPSTGPSNASTDASLMVASVKSPSTSTPIQLFAKPPILSTRTVLTNPASLAPSTARPLVRLTSVVAPKDDRVPPVIGFSDVDLLHARLAEHGRIKDLAYIKWVCMTYASVLKKRRDAVLKAAPTRSEVEVD